MLFDIFGKIVFINKYLNGGEMVNKLFFKKVLRLKKKSFFIWEKMNILLVD